MDSARPESIPGRSGNEDGIVPLTYAPLYVSPLFSAEHPTPQAATTALYALSAPPRFILEIGVRVHLHFLYAPSLPATNSPYSDADPMSIPLAIKGWIAGERSRTRTEVEYVVKNEEISSTIRRAFVRVRIRPGVAALPNLGEMLARRFPGVPTDEPRDQESGNREQQDSGPQGNGRRGRRGRGPRERGRLPAPAVSAVPESVRPSVPSAPGPAREDQWLLTPLLYPIDNSALIRAPRAGSAVATQPYNIWEMYDGNTAPYATQAETDAIRNYGCPIIVGPLGRRETQTPLPVQDRQETEDRREMERNTRDPRERSQERWM